MKRRALLRLMLVPAVLLFGAGHTPYRQWGVYRKRYLLILTSKTHPQSFVLGRRMAAVLAEHLPSSRARVTRAPHEQRIASLISSRQLDVAILRRAAAAALLHGRAPFTDYGPTPLRTLLVSGDFLLVCRDDFPGRHAYLVAKTLIEQGRLADTAIPVNEILDVPVHPGVLAYQAGRPLPPPPEDHPSEEHPHGH